MVRRIGTDVVDVARFRARLSDAYVSERYLPEEASYCAGRARPWECLAARAAAKRAFLRSLDVLAPLESPELWRDIEVVRLESGDVDLRLTGGALAAADSAGATRWLLSMSHTKRTALAVVVLESDR